MKKIVITGGPCAGKSTVIGLAQREFGDRIVVVPEAATILFSGGFPRPNHNLSTEYFEKWQNSFQRVVLQCQRSLEDIQRNLAIHLKASIILCDRGICDGAAYTMYGWEYFAYHQKVNKKEAIESYSMIIHLQSLAVTNPTMYNQCRSNSNPHRLETAQEAQESETRILQAWDGHSNRVVIGNDSNLQATANLVFELIRSNM